MVRCINLQSPEVIELAKQLKTSKVLAATKLAVWQKEVGDTSAIPTATQLDYIKSPSKANAVLGTSYKPEISNTQLKTLVKIVDSLNLKMNKQGVKKRYRVETRIGTNPNAYAWVLLEFDNSIKLDKRIEKAEEQGRYGEAQRLEFMRENNSQLALFTDDITTEVKPGVEELFESNPELANEVYEALGFKQSNLEAANRVKKAEEDVKQIHKIGIDTEYEDVVKSEDKNRFHFLDTNDYKNANQKSVNIEHIYVPEKYRNKGYGLSLYIVRGEELLKEGKYLISYDQHSPEAEIVWQRLLQLGLATQSGEYGTYQYVGIQNQPTQQQKQDAQKLYTQ